MTYPVPAPAKAWKCDFCHTEQPESSMAWQETMKDSVGGRARHVWGCRNLVACWSRLLAKGSPLSRPRLTLYMTRRKNAGMRMRHSRKGSWR